MYRRAVVILIRTEMDPQLRAVNGKIAGLTTLKPWADIYQAFSLAAQLATEAIAAAEELQQMPGANIRIRACSNFDPSNTITVSNMNLTALQVANITQ
jgi:hypothetical protein